MALTKQQKQALVKFWTQNKQDIGSQLEFALKSKTEQKAEVQAWWGAEKAKLEANKLTLNQALLDEQIAKIDARIVEGDDLITNY